jgi:hypothetical protein
MLVIIVELLRQINLAAANFSNALKDYGGPVLFAHG